MHPDVVENKRAALRGNIIDKIIFVQIGGIFNIFNLINGRPYIRLVKDVLASFTRAVFAF